MGVWIIATIFAFFVKWLCGFGNTLVFTSVMSFGTDNIDISPVDLLLAFPSNIVLAWKNRKHINKKVVIPLILLVLAGCLPGAFLLKYVDASKIKIVFGVVIILLGIEMILRDANILVLKESKVAQTVIAILSGILSGMFGIGALLAAYVSRITKSADEYKGSISAVFIADNIFRIILYSAMGLMSLTVLKRAAIMLPFVFGGLFIGILSAKILNERIAKWLVIILLIISGIMLIVS